MRAAGQHEKAASEESCDEQPRPLHHESSQPIVTFPKGQRTRKMPSTSFQPTTRESFLDVARVIALVGMIATHATNTLLASTHKHNGVYDVWRFTTGLVAVMFLVLAGFLFARSASRALDVTRWPWRRTLRYASYIALGYVLHCPARDWMAGVTVSDTAWQKFIQVDILQLMGLGLMGLQVLNRLTPARFHAACAAGALAVASLTPAVASLAWTKWLPEAGASYLWQGPGALFPLFPWVAYLLAGAALAGWSTVAKGPAGARARTLAVAGILLVALGMVGDAYGPAWLRSLDFWRTSPLLVAIRLGCVLLVLAVTALLPPLKEPWGKAIRPFAAHSLLVYVLHVIVIYGSVGFGLERHFGATLSPPEVAGITMGLAILCWAAAWASDGLGEYVGRPSNPSPTTA